MNIKRMTVAEFHDAIKAQGAPSREDITFICPICRFKQSPRDFIEAGVGSTFEDVERFVAFSCIGRWTGANGPRKTPDGKPCNWTLGGLFQLHKLEVVDNDGEVHPRFEVAAKSKAAIE